MKKLLNKVTAVCLVFILVMVPLLSHGVKGDPKAEVASTPYEMAYSASMDVTGDIEAKVGEDGTVTRYDLSKTYNQYDVWYVQAGATVSLKPDLKEVKGTLTWVTESGTKSISCSAAELGYVIVDETKDLSQNVMSVTALDDGKTSEVSGGKIGIYARPIIPEGSGVAEEDIDKLSYSLVASLEIKALTDEILPDIKWVKEDGTEIVTEYVKGGVRLNSIGGVDATIKVVEADGIPTSYRMVYGYVSPDDISTDADIEAVSNWNSASGMEIQQLWVTTSKKYTAFVTFAKQDNSGKYIPIANLYKSDTVLLTNDRTAPKLNNNVTLSLQKYNGTSWQNVGEYNPNNTYYADTSGDAQYRFALTIPLDADGSGVGVDEDEVELSFGVSQKMTYDGTSQYYSEEIELPGSLTTVSLSVSDKAGNVGTRSFGQIMGVDRNLVVHKCMLASDSQGNTQADLSQYYTNKKYYLAIDVSSGYEFKKICATYENENGEAADLWSASPLPNRGSDGLYHYRQNIELPLSEIWGDWGNFGTTIRTDLDGKGNIALDNIHVYIEDKNGKVYDTSEGDPLGSFMFDSIKPKVTNAGLWKKTAEATEWSKVGFREIGSDGSCSVDIDAMTEYRYSFTVDDPAWREKDGSGIDIADIKCYRGEQEYENAVITQEGDTNTFYCTFNKADIPAEDVGRLELKIKVCDRAGNEEESACQLTPSLKRTKKDIEFSKIWLEDASGSTIQWNNAWNITTNKSYTLYVEVSSGYTIDGSSIGIRRSAADDENYISGSIEAGTNQQNQISKRYDATLKFTLPNDRKVNELYSDMLVYVEDTRLLGEEQTPDEIGKCATKSLGQLVYDNTKPVVSIDGELPAEWVKSYNLKYDIQPGTQKVEAKLVEASYTCNGRSYDIKDKYKGTIAVPESTTVEGTEIVFAAKDDAGNTIFTSNSGNKFKVYVDHTKPVVSYPMISGAYEIDTPLTGAPTITASVSDNLTLKRAWMEIKYPSGEVKTKSVTYSSDEGIRNNIKKSFNYTLESNADGKAADGIYDVTVHAEDRAGNIAEVKRLVFEVDNTRPGVTATITSGTPGGKTLRPDGTDMYYRSDVGVQLSYRDKNIQSVYVTDNDADINVTWSDGQGSILLSGEGRHVVRIQAFDRAGNASDVKQVEFIIDKALPTLSLSLNGMPYMESQGMIYSGGDTTIGVTMSDMTVDANDLNYQVVQTKPDMPTTTSSYLKTSSNSFSFYEEAEYEVNLYAVDMAGNASATRSARFRIDRTAPELSISGVSGSGTSADAVTVRCSMREAFWRDAEGVVTIYRRAGDGSSESLYKTINITPTAYESAVSETLTETGEYRIEFEASDKIGHQTTTSQSFILDREAPSITLSGVKNYDVTDKSVEFYSEIKDDFYSSKTVVVEGTRTDIDGKVTKLSFEGVNPHGNPTVIEKVFSEDGIYDITIKSEDSAGNSKSSSVHFIVDKTKPTIAALEQYDGAVLTSFDWKQDLDELVSDLTVCDVHMYLNGSEYDGVSAIEDGSYTLLITAEDELGHYSETSVSFVLDTKAPVFITTGVEDGEVRKEAYSIDISLQLEEDILTSVTLNNKTVIISNNTAHIDVTTAGSYTIHMTARDEAGNEAEKTIQFRYGTEINLWLWIIIILCAVLVLGIIIFIILKRREKDNNNR